MHREFSEAQKSIDFLNKEMKSTKCKANTKIFKEKIMDNAINKEPLFNLFIYKIKTTLDAKTQDEEHETELDPFVNRLTRFGSLYRDCPIPMINNQQQKRNHHNIHQEVNQDTHYHHC